MLIQKYGGPDTNFVSERFTIDWNTYLAVNHSIIIGYIDARNSSMREDKIRFAGYRNLGTVEVEDTIYEFMLLRRARPILFYLTVVKVPGMIPSTLKFTIPLYNNNPGVAITADCYHSCLQKSYRKSLSVCHLQDLYG
ncbi:uncharacterized protein LOC142318748 isoform X3 [Lycorma delicatula]|uniref:uncharacterized protein LOC142318748 isoform X3 n=1 Tax=Lycorma delicatula TaxID=130591 RepID=UPI003F511AC6